RLPAVNLDGGIQDHVVGRHPFAQRRVVDEQLERGAGLAHRLDGAIELVLVVVSAADHSDHGAVGPHRHQGPCCARLALPSLSRTEVTADTAAACRRGSSVVRARMVPRNEPPDGSATCVWCSSAGRALAASASCCFSLPLAAMASSTVTVRSRAASGLRTGLSCDGARIRPASMADSARLSWPTVLPK